MINGFLLKEFGERIKMLRNKEHLSQEALAATTGFHRTYIGMIERGERNISLTNIAVFAKVFKMSVSELLDFSMVNKSGTFNDYELKVGADV